ncbi:PilZ domain-containing protein [Dolichospermum sp. ST_sed1]|nr:PilZ domain-containing protein [Dolichospermum sp. ST_sed1]
MAQHSVQNEKDRNFRLRLRILVSIESTKISGDYFIENLSKGGLFIETRFPLKVGEKCTISFILPHNRKEYVVEALVVWIRNKVENKQNPGMGISFINLSKDKEDEVFDAILKYRELLDEQ